MSDLISDADDQAYAMAKRMDKVYAAWSDLEIEVLEVEVIWDQAIIQHVSSLSDVTRRLAVGVSMFEEYSKNPKSGSPEEKRANRALVFAGAGAEGAGLVDELTAAIDAIRRVLAPSLTS